MTLPNSGSAGRESRPPALAGLLDTESEKLHPPPTPKNEEAAHKTAELLV
jgi:hypothetical protein